MPHGIKGMISYGAQSTMQGFDKPTELFFICRKEVKAVIQKDKNLSEYRDWTKHCIFLGYRNQCYDQIRCCVSTGEYLLMDYLGKIWQNNVQITWKEI